MNGGGGGWGLGVIVFILAPIKTRRQNKNETTARCRRLRQRPTPFWKTKQKATKNRKKTARRRRIRRPLESSGRKRCHFSRPRSPTRSSYLLTDEKNKKTVPHVNVISIVQPFFWQCCHTSVASRICCGKSAKKEPFPIRVGWEMEQQKKKKRPSEWNKRGHGVANLR